MLVPNDLANELHKSVTAKNHENNNSELTQQTINFANGVINMLKSASFSHQLVEGSAPPGGKFNGKASLGKLMNLNPSLLSSNFPGECKQNFTSSTSSSLSSYLLSKAIIEFNKVEGMCTATTNSPGMLEIGSAKNGKLTGLNGNELSAKIKTDLSINETETLKRFYETLCNYIMKNIELTYLPGSVKGKFSAGGGPLIMGTGIKGIIT